MEAFELELLPKDKAGSSSSRRYRNQGLIPSVVYSHGQTPSQVLVSEKEFIRLAKLAKSSQVFSFKSANPELNGKSGLVKEIQRDYMKSRVLHVDFLALREDEEVSVQVGLKFEGEAKGVKLDGGILTVAAHEVTLRCLPRAIPQEIRVNVSDLAIGDSLHIRDLQLPDGVRAEGGGDETIVTVVAVHVVEEAAPAPLEGEAAAAGAVPAEGAAGEAAAATGGEAKAAPEKEKAGK